MKDTEEEEVESRSTWACELKFDKSDSFINDTSHAPRERVSWNVYFFRHKMMRFRHAPRERVSWNKNANLQTVTTRTSRSTWACELK